MTCREARAYQSDSLDDTLEPGVRRKLAQHLGGCPACQEEYRLLAEARWLLSTYGASACPVDLTHLASLQPLRSRTRWSIPRLRARLAIATLALTLAPAGWLWQRASVSSRSARAMPPQLVIRDVAEVQELHESFAVQQSLQGRDGLLLFAPDWGERGR